jgi:spore coat polysaccharide biosynthesis protein SpsF
MRATIAAWSAILNCCDALASVASILEVGSNIGINLRALKVVTKADLWAVEPNDAARQRLVDDGVLPADRVLDGDLGDLPIPTGHVDLSFTRGVLIHVPESDLEQAALELHRVSRRWILVQEYFAPTPTIVEYRGHNDMLWKRDYGGLFLDLFPDLEPVMNGFFWKRTTGLDNFNWWLFRKNDISP